MDTFVLLLQSQVYIIDELLGSSDIVDGDQLSCSKVVVLVSDILPHIYWTLGQ